MALAGIKVVDTPLVRDAMELARESSAPYLFNHAMRSWLFAALIAEGAKPTPDPELLAVSAILHDLGLTDYYAGSERFEVDSANAARSFLKERRVPAHHVRLVWDAIALHTTRCIALHKEPEVVITHSGIAVDVIGAGLDSIPQDKVRAILALGLSASGRDHWVGTNFTLRYRTHTVGPRQLPSAGSIALIAGKHHHAVRGDHDIRRCRKAVCRTTVGIDGSSIPRSDRIHPVVIDIAVKDLEPVAATRESDVVVPPGVVVETRHHDDVPALTFDPAVIGDETVGVVDVESTHRIAAQSRLTPTQADEILGEAQVIDHRLVGAVDAVPPDQQILREVPAPLLIFKEFLAHEELRNPGRRQQQRIGYAGATTRVPPRQRLEPIGVEGVMFSCEMAGTAATGIVATGPSFEKCDGTMNRGSKRRREDSSIVQFQLANKHRGETLSYVILCRCSPSTRSRSRSSVALQLEWIQDGSETERIPGEPFLPFETSPPWNRSIAPSCRLLRRITAKRCRCLSLGLTLVSAYALSFEMQPPRSRIRA